VGVEQLADELSLLADILVEATIQAAWQTIASAIAMCRVLP
jgi:glutamine synthetase adenylyltransferase